MNETDIKEKIEELEQHISAIDNCIYNFKNLIRFLTKLNAIEDVEKIEKMCAKYENEVDEKVIELINLKKEEI